MKLLTTAQAAAIRGVSTARIRQYVRNGTLKPATSTRDHLFRESDVIRLKVKPGGWPKGTPRKLVRYCPCYPSGSIGGLVGKAVIIRSHTVVCKDVSFRRMDDGRYRCTIQFIPLFTGFVMREDFKPVKFSELPFTLT